MNISYYQEKIKICTSTFDKITLDEMDNVKLMDRVEIKYIIPLHLLPSILNEAVSDYKILEINHSRLADYETHYFDTEKMDLYHNHQAGRLNRYKIRIRSYVQTNTSFLEIKHKTNKNRTFKTRIKQPNESVEYFNEEACHFLEKMTPFSSTLLKRNLCVNYSRITLVNKYGTERLTIDINLVFRNKDTSKKFPQLAIAEVKQHRFGSSPIVRILKKHALRSGSISKYCLGIISIFEEIKHNRFKSKLNHLNKIINQYDVFTGNY